MSWMKIALCAAALAVGARAEVFVQTYTGGSTTCVESAQVSAPGRTCVLPNGPWVYAGGWWGCENVPELFRFFRYSVPQGVSGHCAVFVDVPTYLTVEVDWFGTPPSTSPLVDVTDVNRVIIVRYSDASTSPRLLAPGYYLLEIFPGSSGTTSYVEIVLSTAPPGPCSLEADIDGNGSVDITDLAILLANFGCN